MKRFKFTLENVWKDICGTAYLHIVVCAILVIGMAVLLWVGQMVWDMQRNASLSKYENADRLIVAEYKAQIDDKEAGRLEKEISAKMLSEPEKTGIGAFISTTVSWKDESFLAKLQGCSENFWKLNGYEILEGSGPEEEWHGKNVPCFLAEGRALYEKGLHAGDVFTINGIKIEVAGIIRAPKLYGAAAMPYDAWVSVMRGKQAQYQMLVLFTEPVKISVLSGALADKKVLNVCRGTEQEKVYVNSVYALVRERLLIGGMMLIFTLISLSSVISGMIAQERHRMAVRLAIGADQAIIFRENILRIEFLLTLACGADVLLYPLLFGTMYGMSRKLRVPVIAGIWLVETVLVFLLYAGLWKKTFQKVTLTGMLKEGT